MTQNDFHLEPFFWNDRNRAIRPWAQIGVSLYFWQRWVPLLGPQYTVIIIDLRIRATQQTDDAVVVSNADLATTTGLSQRTIERLLAPSRFTPESILTQFLMKHALPKGPRVYSRPSRTRTVYRVAMDDPLHPEDDPNSAPKPSESTATETSIGNDRLIAQLKEAIPSLYSAAALNLIETCGHKVIEQQLEWFSHRDSSWAANEAAAFVAYCRDDRPMPPRLKGEAAYQQSIRASEAVVLDEIRQEQQRLPLDPTGLTERLLAELPPGPRLALRGRFQVHETQPGQLRITCRAPGFLTLLKAYRPAFINAGRDHLGRDVTLVYAIASPARQTDDEASST